MNRRPPPLLSVVIPTFNRAHYLPQAVSSALSAAPDGNVEVLVVPNGPDDSWKASLAPFSGDERIRVNAIVTPNANAARNQGMALARGKYLRFLDDDDYFLPGAALQLKAMEHSGAEISSTSVVVVDETGHATSLMTQQDDSDLLCAMVRPARVCLPVAHLFLATTLRGHAWDETLPHEQDTEWMMRLCSAREWNWLPLGNPAGCWRQHSGARTSDGVGDEGRASYTSGLLIRMAGDLATRQALNEARRQAISEALWDFAHSHFHRSPLTWAKVAKEARRIAPDRRPPDPFFRTPLGRSLDPLLVEYLLFPSRAAKHRWRRAPKNPAGRG